MPYSDTSNHLIAKCSSMRAPAGEWQLLMAALRRPLPVTVRMNSMKHLEIQVAACLEAAEPLLHPSQCPPPPPGAA